jgi:hypothetical protein
LDGELAELFTLVQGTDNAPTTQAMKAVSEVREELERQLVRWRSLKTTKLAAINRQLKEANLPELVVRLAPLEESVGAGEEEEP